MRLRLETQDLSNEDLRAIRFATTHKRTPATRDEAREFLQSKLNEIMADVRYRWNGPN